MRQSRDTNTMASVKDSIDSMNNAKKRINLSHMVSPPQIMTQPKKQNASMANIQGLNRSIAASDLNQSSAGAHAKK